jgi:hypothetical protein
VIRLAVVAALVVFVVGIPVMAQRGAKVVTAAVCSAPLGAGLKTKRAFCDVLIATAPGDSISVAIPPHTGSPTLRFDLHNRFTVPAIVVPGALTFARHEAIVSIVRPTGAVISKAAVVLGNTWVVNAVIISGVMVMILLANLIAAKFPKLPLPPVYALLVLSCIGLYFLDLSRFAFLPYATKALVVGLLTSLPMLFSGIVFIRSYAITDRKDATLGANMIGALVGGLLQSITFVVGIKALLLIVATLYLAAVLSRPKAETAPATT